MSANSAPQKLTTAIPASHSTQHEPLIDEKQAAQFLGGLHPKTVQRMARRGEIPAIRIGRYWRYRASDLNRWIELKSSGQVSTRVNE